MILNGFCIGSLLNILNFRHVHFLCDLFAFSERRTTAARHTRLLQDTQGVRTTDVIVRQPRICRTSAARLPQDNRALYHKNAAKCTAAVRDMYDVSFCLATVL